MVSATGLLLLALAAAAVPASSQKYYGKELGSFKTLEHGVRGTVYAVDARTLHIRNFNYDGQGPDAFFYVGTGSRPSNANGYKVPDENGRTEPLGAYRNKDVTLTLPNGITMDKVQWVSVWCKAYSVDFGNIILPRPVSDYPRPQKLGRMLTREHGVASSEVVAVDAQTLLIPDFTYDGEGPDAHFWAGAGRSPSANGFIVPDENGSQQPLKSYSRKTVVLTLPGDKTVFDIDYLSIWCRQYSADFGHLDIDRRSLNVPPSLKMLGVQPQTKLNCEVLDEELAFEVRWAIAGQSMVMQLVSKIEDGQYMAFGLSGASDRSVMEGADAVVAWLDRRSGEGFAEDYYLQSKRQCSAGQGACPDTQLRGGKSEVRLLNSAFINGFSMLTFQRPLNASDQWDAAVTPGQRQPVVWAVGPVSAGGGVGYHRRRLRGDLQLHFGRPPAWNCPVTPAADGADTPEPPPSPPVPAWHVPPIPCHEPEDRVYYVQLGPTGGARGYSAITGRAGWGVAWYVNGLLVPEINVVRGRTYTFVVEGGGDPDRPAKYHPLYITDDTEGGYQFKTPQERARVRVLAGVEVDGAGVARPTATGRLCQWRPDGRRPAPESGYSSFGAYQRTLQLDCEEGQPGILQWTPDRDTPDTVYYQCFTHRFLGWKINVHDSCSTGSAVPASQLNQIKRRLIKEEYDEFDYYDDGVAESSVRVEQTLPNSVAGPGPQRRPPFIDFSEGSEFDWPSEPPPASVSRPRPRPAEADHQQPNHGFQFDDFPPGFPRPSLPEVPHNMPIPRPDFDFGARLRPRRPETERPPVSSDNLFPPPQSVTGPSGLYTPGDEYASTERYQFYPEEEEEVRTTVRLPEPPTAPPRRTQLNRVNRPTLGGAPDYQSSTPPPPPPPQSQPPPPPQPQPSPRPVHSNGRRPPFYQPAPVETYAEPEEVPPSLPPPSRSTRPPTISSQLPTLPSESYEPSSRPAATLPPPTPPSRPPWTVTAASRQPPERRESSFQPLLVPESASPAPGPVAPGPVAPRPVAPRPAAPVPAVVFGRPPGVSSVAARPLSSPAFSPPRPSTPGHGFDPSDVVFEGGFLPVKHSDRNNPPLAFEVADVARVDSGPESAPQSSGQSGPLLPSQPDDTRLGGGGRRPQAVSIPLPESVVPVGPPGDAPDSTLSDTTPVRPPSVQHFTQPDEYRPDQIQARPEQSQPRPAEHQFRPAEPQFQPEQQQFRPENTEFRPERDQFRPEGDQFRPDGDQFRPEGDQFRPEAEFRPENAQFRPEPQQFRPGGQIPSSGLAPPAPDRPPFQFASENGHAPGDDQRPRPPPRRRPQRPPSGGGFLGGLLSYLPGLGGGRPARRRHQPPPPPGRFGNPNRRLEVSGPSAPAPPGRFTAPRLQPVFESAPFRPSPVDLSIDEPYERRDEPVQAFLRVGPIPAQGTPPRYQQALRRRPERAGQVMIASIRDDEPQYQRQYSRPEDGGRPDHTQYNDGRPEQDQYVGGRPEHEQYNGGEQQFVLSKRTGPLPTHQQPEQPPIDTQTQTSAQRLTHHDQLVEKVPEPAFPPAVVQRQTISSPSDRAPSPVAKPKPITSVPSNRDSPRVPAPNPVTSTTSNELQASVSTPSPTPSVTSTQKPSRAPTPGPSTIRPSKPARSRKPTSTPQSTAAPVLTPAARAKKTPTALKKSHLPPKSQSVSESTPHNILEDIWSRMREAEEATKDARIRSERSI